MKTGGKKQQRSAVVVEDSAALGGNVCRRFEAIARIGLCSLLLIGCSGRQSSLDPAGLQAGRINHLWWQNIWIVGTVYLLVLLFLLLPFRRGRLRRLNAGSNEPILSPSPIHERRLIAIVSGFVILTVGILFYLCIGDYLTQRALGSLATEKDALTIKITGHQWWWEAQYLDPTPSNLVMTANELHIPVGRPIHLELQSVDVIHSFWVPNLHGKKDLIPGHPTALWLQADRAGTFAGQCAEFCGYQHAHMRFEVIAEPPDKFQSWLTSQRQIPAAPASVSERKGYAVFMSKTCAMCHNIQGTPANGRVGPDLTHIASRQWLAAGSFPNARGYRGGWILNPQHLKPGVRMPQHDLTPDELNSLLDYLETLK